MNLKNNNLLKRRLMWVNTKCKKNAWRHHYFTPLYQISQWYDLQFLRYRVWKTDIGNYRSFIALLRPPPPPPSLKTKKSKFRKNEKKIAGDIIILHICTKKHNYLRCSSWDTEDTETDTIFWKLGPFFAFLHPLTTWKSKFWKSEENIWRYHHLKHVYQKPQSYDVCFLRYGVWQTHFFVIFDHFCSFTLLLTQKIKIWKKCKKPGDIILLHMCTINEDHMMYVSWDERRHRHFLPFDRPNNPKNQNFGKMSKPLRDVIILQLRTTNDDQMM